MCGTSGNLGVTLPIAERSGRCIPLPTNAVYRTVQSMAHDRSLEARHDQEKLRFTGRDSHARQDPS